MNHWRWWIFMILALVLAACGGTNQPRIARIEIVSGNSFLTAAGQSTTLIAKAFDLQNNEIKTTFGFRSSDPSTIGVTTSGVVTSLVGLGSSEIVIEADGVKSAPFLMTVATPADNVVLLTDAQILSVVATTGAPASAMTSSYQVKLAVPLEIGTVFMSRQTNGVSGKVVSSNPVSGGFLITFSPVKLQQLFKHLKFNWSADGQDLPLDFSGSDKPQTVIKNKDGSFDLTYAAGSGRVRPLAPKEYKLGPFECEIEGKVSVNAGSGLSVNITNEVKFNVDGSIQDGVLKDLSLGVNGQFGGKILGGLKFDSSLDGSLKCRAVVAKLSIPVFGPISLLVAPVVPIGLGIDLSAKVTGPNMELGMEGSAKGTLDIGFKLENEVWTKTSQITVEKSLIPRLKVPKLDDLKLEASAYLYAYSGLWFRVFVFYAEFIDAKLGLEAAANYAFPGPQAKQADYASNYDIKTKGELKPGKDFQTVLDEIFGEGGLTIGATIGEKLKESPTGTATADKSEVQVGEQVKFKISLNPATLEFPVIGYNVENVKIYRIRGDKDPELMATRVASKGMSEFDWTWTTKSADAGANDFYAFVETNGVLGGVPLEINKDSKMRVIVGGGSQIIVTIKGAATENYKAPATGSKSANIDLELRFDESKPPYVYLPKTIQGLDIPGVALYYMTSSLKGSMTMKNDYHVPEEPCDFCGQSNEKSYANLVADYTVESLTNYLQDNNLDYPLISGELTKAGQYKFPFTDQIVKGKFTKSEDSKECDETAVKENLTGTFNQSLGEVKYDMSGSYINTEKIVRGNVTFQKTLSLDKISLDVPVTITITWKLSVAESSPEGANFPNLIPQITAPIPIAQPNFSPVLPRPVIRPQC